MHKLVPYIKLLLTVLLFTFSLVAALWECRIDTPGEDWSKIVKTRGSDGKATGYQMMVYVDRPVVRSDQTCETYLRIKNVGKHPLELTSTYVTNRHYVQGKLYGEAIGDWKIPDSPLELLPGEVRDVPCRNAIMIRYPPDHSSAIGTRGFQFNGFGLGTNTVTVYVLPSRPFWLALAAVAALAMWRAWLGAKSLRQRNQ